MRIPTSPIFIIVSLIVLSTSAIGEEVHLVLGDKDDATSILYLPRQVEEGPDGNLYVLDWGDSYIKVFSPAGEFLRSIGGPGEGPGEFQRIDVFDSEEFGTEESTSVSKVRLVLVASESIDIFVGMAL